MSRLLAEEGGWGASLESRFPSHPICVERREGSNPWDEMGVSSTGLCIFLAYHVRSMLSEQDVDNEKGGFS